MFVLVGALCVLVMLYWLLIHPYGYWKKRGVPYLKPTILFGNMGDAISQKRNFSQIYQDIYNSNKFRSIAYVGIYKFRNPAILLKDMELVKNIIIKDSLYFYNNDVHVSKAGDPLFGRNPFVLKNKEWKLVRGSITSGITSSKVKSMVQIISKICKDLLEYLENDPEATGPDGLDAKEMAARFTTDVVAACAFGLDAGSLQNPNAEFREMGRKFFTIDYWTGIKVTIAFAIPSLVKWLRIGFFPKEATDWFTSTVYKTIKFRQENGIVRNDYLDLLIGLKNKKSEYKFEDIDIAAQAMTFFSDGFETSSITLSYTLYELANNPHVQTKLREEIETVLAKHEGEITYEAIQEMSYLDNVLSETLRMHPPLGFMTRLCTKKYELPPHNGVGPNLILEPGTPVVISIMGIHYDPKIYPNPYTFDPDRFTEENKRARPKCSFLAFGEGPRICLGMRLGIALSKAAIVTIVKNFDIRMNRKTKRPLENDLKHFLTMPKGGIWLNFIKRKN